MQIKEILLAGKAYNSRTKGAIAKVLKANNIPYVALGNGSAFTGFAFKKPVAAANSKKVVAYINTLETRDDIYVFNA